MSFFGVEDVCFCGLVLKRDYLIGLFDSDELVYMIVVLNENVNSHCWWK